MALLAPMLWKVAKTDEIGGVRLHLVHPEEDAQFGFSVLTNGDHSRIMRLILAAPELLEELKRLLAAVQADDIGPGHIEDLLAACTRRALSSWVASGRAP